LYIAPVILVHYRFYEYKPKKGQKKKQTLAIPETL